LSQLAWAHLKAVAIRARWRLLRTAKGGRRYLGPEATTALAAIFKGAFSRVCSDFIADSSSPATLIGLCRPKKQLSELLQKARKENMAQDTDPGRPFINNHHPATARKE
jgi:hypothetical protein